VVSARWAALAVVAAIVAGLAGCGGGGGPTKVTKVALVTPGSHNDTEWSLRARSSFEALANRLAIRAETAENPPAGQVEPSLEQLSNGTQLVIAHENTYAAAARTAADRTKVPELVWGDPAAQKPGRVADVEIDGGPAGWIAGFLSARSSITRRLAVTIVSEGTSWDARTWNTMAGGFIAGARAFDPRIRLWIIRATPAEAASTTRRMIVQHNIEADFVLAGPTSVAMYNMLKAQIGGERYYVGIVGDKERINQENIILASVLYNFEGLFRQAIEDVRRGTFGKHGYTLSLANRGLTMTATGRTPSDAFEAAMGYERRIVAGQVSVPATPTTADVEELLRGTLRQ
jgi:basic membrane lipoprotein Med (substrate-binding protein (PBP1-ABC) superfamily)